MSAIYIKHIDVIGLLGYQNISWDVNADVNILGGVNGSGKSTLFHICYNLIGYGYIREEGYAQKVESVKIVFTNDFQLLWDKQAVDHNFQSDRRYVYHDLDKGRVNKEGLVTIQRTQLLDDKGEVTNPDELVSVILTDLLSAFEQAILDSQKVGNAEQNGDRTYLDVLLADSIGVRNQKLSQIFINSFTRPEGEDGKKRQHQYFISAKDARYLTLFNDALLTFFGDRYMIKSGMESQITMISKKTNKVIAYQDLSLGEKEMLLLILRASNTFDNPVVIWLDEPDLGLHVDWQVRLVKSLKELNPNIQLFISTHAPSMVEGNFEKVKEMSQITTTRQ